MFKDAEIALIHGVIKDREKTIQYKYTAKLSSEWFNYGFTVQVHFFSHENKN